MPAMRRSFRVALRTPPDSGKEERKKGKKTAAEASRDFRMRRKEDPETYKLHCEYENNRVKVFMATLSDEKRKAYNEVTAKRAKRWRNKQKANGNPCSSYIPPKTRKEKEEQRNKWAENQRKRRANMTEEDRELAKKKRRANYAAKQQQLKEDCRPHDPISQDSHQASTSTQVTPSSVDMTSSNLSDSSIQPSSCKEKIAMYKAVSRTRKSLPKDKKKRAQVLSSLLHRSSPATKKFVHAQNPSKEKECAARKELDFAIDSIQESMVNLRKRRNKKDMKARRTVAAMLSLKRKYTVAESTRLGIGYRLFVKSSKVKDLDALDLDERKKRKDCIAQEAVDKVEQFYRRTDVSRSLPDARSARKKKSGEALLAMRVMERSSESAFVAFKEDFPDVKLSITKFKKLRPKDVYPSTRIKKRDCLCEYCENTDLKLDALRRFSVQHNLDNMTYKDRYELNRDTLCPKIQGEYKQACIDRKCLECGTSSVEVKLRPLLETHIAENVTFSKWEFINYVHNGVNKKKLGKTRKTVPAPEFVAQLVSDATTLSKHLFNARWQGNQYDSISKDVPGGWVVFCQDFAENFTCWVQDEAQGAHWAHDQVTLHANVASYRCPVDGCELMVNHTLMVVSNDMKHCHDAVHTFNSVTLNFLVHQQVPMNKIIMFSDGAPTQYKNKNSFCDLSHFFEDYGLEGERHFFGTRHGKGPCDREFGTLKKAVNRRIKGRQAEIHTAADFFSFCRDHYSRETDHCHYKRSFFYVPTEDIDRHRNRAQNLKPLPQTRQQHCLRRVEPFVLTYRERSCFCPICTGRDEGRCTNADITGEWNVASVLKGRACRRPAANNSLPASPEHGDDNANRAPLNNAPAPPASPEHGDDNANLAPRINAPAPPASPEHSDDNANLAPRINAPAPPAGDDNDNLAPRINAPAPPAGDDNDNLAPRINAPAPPAGDDNANLAPRINAPAPPASPEHSDDNANLAPRINAPAPPAGDDNDNLVLPNNEPAPLDVDLRFPDPGSGTKIILIDSFYPVTWNGKPFLCQVKAFDDNEVNRTAKVHFMRQVNELYTWPARPDISWEPFSFFQDAPVTLQLDENCSTHRQQFYRIQD
ncbi:hypothetical protein V1264_024849 [Littorina saxatilis]